MHTYSYGGLKKVLDSEGFSGGAAFFSPLPNYRHFKTLIALENEKAIIVAAKLWLGCIMYRSSLLNKILSVFIWLSLFFRLPKLNVYKYLTDCFIVIARK